MVVPAFGWSVGDIALAIKLISQTFAFREVGGAKKQHEATAAFLDTFYRSLKRVKEYIDSNENDSDNIET